MTGKEKCELLKGVRRRIAAENGIPYEIPECPYMGECTGTCPRCESELAYLTTQIAEKKRNGIPTQVDGLCKDAVEGRHARTDSIPLREFEKVIDAAEAPKYPLLYVGRLKLEQDGQGITTLVGGAGCPLHCTWCINKEPLQGTPEFVGPEELLDKLMVDDLYFRSTGGGVTFGGGEPLLHADFIRQFRRISPSGWRITAETSLAVPEENIRKAIPVVDSFIVDIKSMSRHTYAQYTGGKMKLMKENLRILLQEAGPERVVVRVPVIPTYNTRWEMLRSIRKLKRMGVTKIDPFRYITGKSDDSKRI